MTGHVTDVAEGVHRLSNGAAGKASGDLDAVLLTHAHTDHTGFAGQARATTRALSGCCDVPQPNAGVQA